MIYRKKIIAGNWKMNKTATEAKQLIQDILEELGKFDTADVIVCPPYTALAAMSEVLGTVPNVALGAQNVHHLVNGAYTGEISAGMLRDLYCRYVIVGHSERRQYFGESNTLIRDKAKSALEAKLKPILCIGETLSERESGKWQSVLKTQLTESLDGFSDKEALDITLAYEPVWAIGTGKTASPAQAQEAHAYIRGIVEGLFSAAVAEKIRIQYGGSVKADNAKELLNQPDIDGALVGGASLEGKSFAAIIKNACVA